MKSSRKVMGLVALVALMFGGSGTRAADPELKAEDMQQELRDLKKEVQVLRALVATSNRTTDAEVRLLADRLERIEKMLSRLAPSVSTRSASAFTPDPIPYTNTSAVRLDNRMGVTATVTLNGVSYSIPPYGVRTLRNLPPGEIVYSATAEGRGVGSPVRSALVPNETLTVTIR